MTACTESRRRLEHSPPIDPEFVKRVRERMSWFDRLPREIRDLANEHGSTLIRACLDCGVRKPNRIAHLINVFASVGLYGNGRRGLR